MSPQRRAGPTRRGVVAVVVGLVLCVAMVLPWKPGMSEPIVLGVMPAPLFFWVVWTALFIGYVGWLCRVWDPYRDVVRRNLQETSGRDRSEDGA